MFFLLAREGENTVPVRSIPIIVVPGIMGTRLRLTQKEDGTTKIWDPDDKLVMTAAWVTSESETMRNDLHYERVTAELYEDGTSHSATERARGWASLSTTFYGDLLRALTRRFEDETAARCPVYAFGYDWRQSNTDSAKHLATFAQQTMAAEHAELAIFVTHSMGGFVARQAFVDQPALASKTLGVVHLGQPVRGAPVAYRRFMFGTDSSFDGYGMRFLIGGAPENTMRLFSALPGAMQLLPSDTRINKSTRSYEDWMRGHRRDGQGPFPLPPGPASVYAWYRNGRYPPGLAAGLLDKRAKGPGTSAAEEKAFRGSRDDAKKGIDAAQKFHNDLDTHCHRLTWTISATGVETDEQVVFFFPRLDFEGLHDLSIEETEVVRGRSQAGDGTVPTWSAHALLDGPIYRVADGVDATLHRKFELDGVVHDTMCATEVTQRTVFDIIRTLLEAGADLLLNDIRSNDNEMFARYFTSHNPLVSPEERKSAEIELRAAKWYREQGKGVRILENPDTGKTADLQVDGKTIEVKHSGERRTAASVRSQILDGFFKADETLLVRGTGPGLTLEELDAIGAEALEDRPGNVLTIIDESELPKLFS